MQLGGLKVMWQWMWPPAPNTGRMYVEKEIHEFDYETISNISPLEV